MDPNAPDLVYTPTTVRQQLEEARRQHRRLARSRPNAFMTYVLKDEETGRSILQTEDQMEWQDLADRERRLLIWGHVESGKTNQIAVGRVLYELGRNPNLRVAIVSNTADQAAKICLAVQKYIERSEELHEVFPDLRRDRRMPWNNHQLYVERETRAKDPSVQTCGIHGNILGARIDLLILDDLLDYENTHSPSQREDLWAWYHATLEGRLTRHARVWAVGNAWHREDFLHRLAQSPAWCARRYPVIDPDTGATRWPERWPAERIEQKRLDLQSPTEFARQMLCIARSDEDSRFKKAWIDQCLRRGLGRQLRYALTVLPPGYKTYTGVDLGVRVKAGSDVSVLFTIVVHPNGDREVLDVQAGRWAGPEIVQRIIDVHHRYHSIVLVESVSAQQFIVDFTKALSAVPVKPFNTTGKGNTATNVHHMEFGIEGLATEMANAKWIIPAVQVGSMLRAAHPQLDAWVNELLYYEPRAHPGDRLMASWFAQSGARVRRPKVQYGHLNLTRR